MPAGNFYIGLSAGLKKQSLATASVKYAVYKTKKGKYELKERTVTPKSRDRTIQRLNAYYAKPGDKVRVAYVYAERSRVMRSTPNLIGVKTSEGKKGWVTTSGRFIGKEDLRAMFYSVDSMTIADSDAPLTALWDSLSEAEKAAVADELRDFDWDDFWKEMYPTKFGHASVDIMFDRYDDLVLRVAKAIGRD